MDLSTHDTIFYPFVIVYRSFFTIKFSNSKTSTDRGENEKDSKCPFQSVAKQHTTVLCFHRWLLIRDNRLRLLSKQGDLGVNITPEFREKFMRPGMIYPGKTEYLYGARQFNTMFPTGEGTGISMTEQPCHFLLRIPGTTPEHLQLVRNSTMFHPFIVCKEWGRYKGG